jgi:hypothetical protein
MAISRGWDYSRSGQRRDRGICAAWFVFWRLPLSTGGRGVGALHQFMIDDFIVDLVTKRLVVERDTIVLIFHHSIIYVARPGRAAGRAGSCGR